MTTNFNNKLSGYTGNTKSLLVVVSDPSGNLMDITNYDAYFYMRKYPIVAGQPIDVSIMHYTKDASSGSFFFNLTESDLNIDKGDYLYEVIIDDSSTNRYTIIQDKFNLNQSIK